jgi:hypothetical protein
MSLPPWRPGAERLARTGCGQPAEGQQRLREVPAAGHRA